LKYLKGRRWREGGQDDLMKGASTVHPRLTVKIVQSPDSLESSKDMENKKKIHHKSNGSNMQAIYIKNFKLNNKTLDNFGKLKVKLAIKLISKMK